LFPAANPSKRRKIRKDDTVSDNETEETCPENSIRLSKTTDETLDKHSESPSGDIDSNADTLLDESSSSFSENPQKGNKHINSDSENEDESVSEELIFHKLNQAYDFNTNNILEIRDSLLVRKDNIIIFVTQDGEPCDDSSHMLAKDNKVSVIKDAKLGRARVIKQGSRYLIILVTKSRAYALLGKETLKEALRSLYDVTLELNLQTISLSDVDYVSRANVKKFLRELFYDCPTKIFVCDNRVTIPEPSERDKIITEHHASAIQGHKVL
jgi:uncharacterized Zn ribbon protein